MRHEWLCRAGMLLLVTAAPACGQFVQLTATDDGTQLYFTSQMLLQGAAASLSPSPESRLYRFGTEGVTLFAERGALTPEGTASSGDGVSGPRVSGDGSLVAFTLNDVCLDTLDCMALTNVARIRGRLELDFGRGNEQVSRNGRWALVTNDVFDDSNSGPPVESWSVTFVDLTSGQHTSVPSAPMTPDTANLYTLASDGSVLVGTAQAGSGNVSGFGLWKQGNIAPIQFPANLVFTPVALSDDARTLICYVHQHEPPFVPFQIVALDLASGRVAVVFSPDDSTLGAAFMGISNDGRRVLYRTMSRATANGPAYVWDARTGTTTPVPLADGEVANAGTLSGSGDFAFVATTRARIVKFSLKAGAASTLFPAPPYCDDPGALGAGSMVRLHCSFQAPLTDLEGQVFLNDQPIPVVWSNGGDIRVQIPWSRVNFPPAILSFRIPTDSPFQPSQPLSVYDGAPAMMPADPVESSLFGIKIIKGDWSSLVTTQPAPGDVVHIFMTGLGWTQSQEVTGVPASSPP